ncbi:hypothetical protein Hypma_007329 [Hypsizygus marmoreus]|uniref:Uncharacterized protein n=1 Tax=Hypsizygus marmoreus TaxID=39966 RepID=A0A369KBJ9_HYPMA|nr:hypothetical protein Hypma_007329 [Hypsizygus marmoreus]
MRSFTSLITSGIKTYQVRLSEELRLLQLLGFTDLNVKNASTVFSNEDKCATKAHTELCILDTIAVCLISGEQDNVIAAALDKRENITLILAKNRHVVPEDTVRVSDFMSAVEGAELWDDVLPFLTKYSKEQLDKRIAHLRLSMFQHSEWLAAEARGYQFSSALETEFPEASVYLEASYPEAQPPWTPLRIILDVIQVCFKECDGFEMQSNELSYVRFYRLYGAANTLRNSAFLAHIVQDPRRAWRIEKLKRRLGKICQYSRIDLLIKQVRKGGVYPFRWIEMTSRGTGEGRHTLCNSPQDVVARVWKNPPGKQPAPSSKTVETHPNLTNWDEKLVVDTHIHAELRIILHLSRPFLSGSQKPSDMQLPIGCSKRSCLCCMLWMESFNKIVGTHWMTGGSHGKPYDAWALPGTAGDTLDAKWREFDVAVINGVHERVVKHVEMLLTTKPRTNSDDLASSGSELGDPLEEARRARARKHWLPRTT